MSDIFKDLVKLCDVEPCGSRVTCSPAPTDTDADYLVYVRSHREQDVADVVDILASAGFEWEGASEHYQCLCGNSFMSWRRDNVNLIVSSSPTFALRHRAATALCKALNLMSKPHRIAVFQAVLYGDKPAPEVFAPHDDGFYDFPEKGAPF
jgi:hypothetical protein